MLNEPLYSEGSNTFCLITDIEEAASDAENNNLPSDTDDSPQGPTANIGDVNELDKADAREPADADINEPVNAVMNDAANGGEEYVHGINEDDTTDIASDHDMEDEVPLNKKTRESTDGVKTALPKSDKASRSLGGGCRRKTARKSCLETTLSTIMGSFSSANEEVESKHIDIENKRLNLEFKKLQAEDKQREFELTKLESEERQKREEREHMLKLTQMMLNSQRAPQQVQPQFTGMPSMSGQSSNEGFTSTFCDQQYYNM